MSPEDRAHELVKWLPADQRHQSWVAIRDALYEAMDTEREACARLADEETRTADAAAAEACRRVAAAIRARTRHS